MKLAHLALALAAAALPFSGCECDVEPFDRLAPIIAIGDPFDPTFSVCAIGLNDNDANKFRACAYDFGTVDIGRARVFSFTIRNPSPVKLDIRSITFGNGSDPAFSFDGALPESVASAIGKAGEVVNVKFQPLVEGPVTATIVIESDGENLSQEPPENVVIQLSANGVSRCRPVIQVVNGAGEPRCDFGAVGVGATAFCDLTVNNLGACELIVDDIGFAPGTPSVFGPQSNFVVPTAIPGGTGVSLRLYARPVDTDIATGTLYIGAQDSGDPRAAPCAPGNGGTCATIPLSVQGADVPTCVARVSRINGTPNSNPAPAVEPLDDVEFSADQSVASREGGRIQQWAWEILDKPFESSVRLTSPSSQETRVQFSSATGNVSGVDVAGTFTLGLVVTDDLGGRSTQCSVTVNSVPRSGLHVQLTWDVAVNDIDLHLARNGTNWCTGDDCYFGGRNRNWGGGDANPSLDIDDLSGFGPENIRIERPADGNYTVGVGMYSHSADSTVTAKIFIGGQLEYEGFHLMTEGDTWLPARVEVRNGASTVVELNDTSNQAGSCWGGF
ncbi:MAG: choice-of-anchor D domain-containing protein [Deltaproteobacteria bacterium]|nr:choice-of-anchor D domain-containing protein [Deltaproteobacteria bacterium]